MAMSRKDKKRMAIYAAGAAAATMRGAVKTAWFIGKTGIAAASALNSMIFGSAMAITDELVGSNSRPIIGDEMLHGCSALLNNGVDWGNGMATRGIDAVEKYTKNQIMWSKDFGR